MKFSSQTIRAIKIRSFRFPDRNFLMNNLKKRDQSRPSKIFQPFQYSESNTKKGYYP